MDRHIQYVTPAARRVDHCRPAEPSPRKYLHLYTNCDRRVVLPLKSTILLYIKRGHSHAYKRRKPQVRHSCDVYTYIRRVRKQGATLLLSLTLFHVVFTARRNARIASAVLAIAIPSVCLSVRLSHAGIVSKRRHVARCSLHCQIAKRV